MNKNILTLCFLVLLSSCQYKLDGYVNKVGQTFLSITGGISDKLENQTIQLFYTSDKIDYSSYSSPVTGAIVYVTDEKGNKYTYVDSGKGIYQTADKVAGHAGGTYILHMEIDGKTYVSTPEVLPACPAIDKVFSEATIDEGLPQASVLWAGFDVYLSFKDAPEAGNYYRWTWKHYDRLDVCATCKGRAWNDVTNSCNDASAPPYAALLKQHCRTTCFDINYSTDFNILSDDYVNGKQVEKVFVTRAPYKIDENYISGYKYFLAIEQRAISKRTYDLFSLLKNTGNTGSFFDVPTLTKFNLNISCTNDATQKIIGVFEVYGVQTKNYSVDLSQTIPRANLKIVIPPSSSECSPFPCTSPCIESLYRTRTMPDGWQN